MNGRPGVLATAAVIALTAMASRVAAQPPPDAREAYRSAVEAAARDDYDRAASLFLEADALRPADTIVVLALKAAALGADPVVAMTAVARARERGVDAPLTAKVAQKFEGQVGQIRAECVGCTIRIDGGVVPTGGSPTLVRRGSHEVTFAFSDHTDRVAVVVAGADVVRVEPPRAAEPPASPVPLVAGLPTSPAANVSPPAVVSASPPPRAEPSRDARPVLTSTWFWVGMAATVVGGAATTWSAVDTVNAHDRYVAHLAASTVDDRKSGVAAQTRTNVFLGVTVGVAALTTLAGALSLLQRAQ